jgi:general secretion pathway protein G
MARALASGEQARVARCRCQGFTLVELLVVPAAVALLLSVAAPRYMQHMDAARETALKHDLRQVRDAVGQHYADLGRYPDGLEELVSRRYLRALPVDPVTGRADTWLLVPPQGTAQGRVADVRSGAAGNGIDGTPYGSW